MSPDRPAGSDHARLIARLREPARHGPACREVRLIETHISSVLLTGAYAYKLKKPVALGFLDFTTLDARRRYCHAELALNRRLASALYLDVVPITGTIDDPVLGGTGPALDYAVRMREFPQDALATRELERGELSRESIDALAAIVAEFHRTIEVAPPDGAFGLPADILRQARDNLATIAGSAAGAGERPALAALDAWTRREFRARESDFAARRRDGFVRNCHGDLHLGNIARVDGALTIFDCIEFNDRLRWIDVQSEVAFTAMDLADRGREDLAHRYVDAYLAATGDYAGLRVLPFYLVYRALVRAKVACLRAGQLADTAGNDAAVREFRGYLALARRYAAPHRAAVVVTHGLSGSGKTTLSQALLERIGAVRIRTDLERKRLAGLPPLARSGAGLDAGLYATDVTRATYARVCGLARGALSAGRVALLDGTFLHRWQRDLARALAADARVPFVVVDFRASEATLRRRIEARARRGTDASDADLAVLEAQLAAYEPLAADEAPNVVAFDAEMPIERARDAAAWERVVERLDPTQRAAAPTALDNVRDGVLLP